jgi:hypothetical protein
VVDAAAVADPDAAPEAGIRGHGNAWEIAMVVVQHTIASHSFLRNKTGPSLDQRHTRPVLGKGGVVWECQEWTLVEVAGMETVKKRENKSPFAAHRCRSHG